MMIVKEIVMKNKSNKNQKKNSNLNQNKMKIKNKNKMIQMLKSHRKMININPQISKDTKWD